MSVAKTCFTDHMHGRPIAGTPAPLACPFCGCVDMVSVAQGTPAGTEYGPTFHVECEKCGSEGPPAQSQVAAAEHWNTRPRSVSTVTPIRPAERAELPESIRKAVSEQSDRLLNVCGLLQALVAAADTDEVPDYDAAMMGVLELATSIHVALDGGELAKRAAQLAQEQSTSSD